MATTNQLTVDANTIGLWHMDGTTGSAGKINDSGVNNLDITETGTPTAQTGVIAPTSNGAYRCSAGTNYIQVADNALLDTGSNFTIEGWFKTSSNNCGLFHRYTGAADRMFRAVITAGSKLRVIFYDNTDTNFTNVDSTTSVDTNAWIFFAITYDGTNVRMYVNPASSTAETVSNQVKTLANSASPLIIGKGNPVETNDPTVDVDEWRYSNFARTGTEIFDYYNGNISAAAGTATATFSSLTPSISISMTATATPATATLSALTPSVTTPTSDWDTQDKSSSSSWTNQNKS